MLLRGEQLEGIAAGSVDLAFRRWRRPTVKAGGTLRTAIGVLWIDAVDQVHAADITERDAQRAGHASRAALIEQRPAVRAPDLAERFGGRRQDYRGATPRTCLERAAPLH